MYYFCAFAHIYHTQRYEKVGNYKQAKIKKSFFLGYVNPRKF